MTFENQIIELGLQLLHIKALLCGILFMNVCSYVHNCYFK
mgnify:CR=1 FL=1|jgi:hypothetical protein